MSVTLRARPLRSIWLVTAVLALVLGWLPAVHAQPPTNDEIEGARFVTVGPKYTVSTLEATDGVSDPACDWSTIHNTVWFTYTPAQSGPLVASALPSRYADVELAIFVGPPEALAPVACEDLGWEGEAENIRFKASAGFQYYFMLGDSAASHRGGEVKFDLHLPVRVFPRFDDTGWARTSDGNAVITGRIRCSRDERIFVSATLTQSGSTTRIAEGTGQVRCFAKKVVPWLTNVTRFQGGPFRSGRASLQIEFTEPDDQVTVQRDRYTRLVMCTQIGTLHADRMTGTRGRDRLCGLYGDDTLIGGGGRDILIGHRGADRMLGGDQHDKLSGGPGPDDMSGGNGPDRLAGDEGNDNLVGGAGIDLCRGGPGRDRRESCERG